MKNQKGNSILIVLIIAAIILVGGYLLFQRGTISLNNQPSGEQGSVIQNDSELTGVSSDLDSTNIDSMDTYLNQNDTDAASF